MNLNPMPKELQAQISQLSEEKQKKVYLYWKYKRLEVYEKLQREGYSAKDSWIKAGFPESEFNIANTTMSDENYRDKGVAITPYSNGYKKITLYRWFCTYMEMTPDEIDLLDFTKLTFSQQAALKLVRQVVAGKWPQTKEIINRSEGPVAQKIEVDAADTIKAIKLPFGIEKVVEKLNSEMELIYSEIDKLDVPCS